MPNSFVCRGTNLKACSLHISDICDEGLNSHGPGQCVVSSDCSLGRTCSFVGKCEGESRINHVECSTNSFCAGTPLYACTDHLNRICDENLNAPGSGRCSSDDDCSAGRQCSDQGVCHGEVVVNEIDCNHLAADENQITDNVSNNVTGNDDAGTNQQETADSQNKVENSETVSEESKQQENSESGETQEEVYATSIPVQPIYDFMQESSPPENSQAEYVSESSGQANNDSEGSTDRTQIKSESQNDQPDTAPATESVNSSNTGTNDVVIETKPNLNDMLVKILGMSDQVCEKVKAGPISDGKTLNEIIEEFTSEAFSNIQPLVENPENKHDSQDIHRVSSTLISENAHRLLKLLKIYHEHISLKGSNFILDPKHYSHIQNFKHRLRCFTTDHCAIAESRLLSEQNQDQTVSVNKHLEESQHSEISFWKSLWCPVFGKLFGSDCHDQHIILTTETQKHLQKSAAHLEDDSEPKYEITAEPEQLQLHNTSEDFERAIRAIVSQIPECLTNKDIKRVSSEFIERAHSWLTNFDQNFPNKSIQIDSSFNQFKTYVGEIKDLTPEQLKEALGHFELALEHAIDNNLSSDKLPSILEPVIKFKAALTDFKDNLNSYIPMNSVLESELELLLTKIESHVQTIVDNQDADEDELTSAREYLKTDFKKEFAGVDHAKLSELIQKVLNNIDEITKSNFGLSINAANMNYIMNKLTQAAHADVDQLKDLKKKSEFIFDVNDLNTMIDNVIDELKKSTENRQTMLKELSEFSDDLKKVNDEFSFSIDTGDKARDAANVLIKYNEALMKVLTSDRIYDLIGQYVNRFKEIVIAHTQPLSPLVAYTYTYKVLTSDIENPEATQVTNPTALRILRSTVFSQMRRLDKLSKDDREFFRFFNHLIAEWAQTTNQRQFAKKLDRIISFFQGRSDKLDNFDFVHTYNSHLQIDPYRQIKDTFIGLSRNLKESIESSEQLAQTLNASVELSVEAKKSFSLRTPSVIHNSATHENEGLISRFRNLFSSKKKFDVHYENVSPAESLAHLLDDLENAQQQAFALKTNFQDAEKLIESLTNPLPPAKNQ